MGFLLHNQNEIMKIIFEKSAELIFIFCKNGEIFGANPLAKKETGYGENIYGMNITSVFPTVFQKEDDIVNIEDKELYGNDEIEKLKTVVYCNNQICFPVLLKYNRILFKGDYIGICQAINISEYEAVKKQKNKTLAELNEVTKIKNEFMANVTHELRTPLNGIKGLAESLFDTNINNEQKEILKIILHCCDNMSKIINDILDVSKIESGKLTIEKQEFDFNDFLKRLIKFNTHIINEKGLKFIVNIGKGIPVNVIGDELRLGQIINNFLSNAIKFTKVGSITMDIVKTFETESEIELFFLIIDTGIGIAKEDIDRLFIPFSQVDGSITRRFGGTGLGLSICKQLVELMGGSIQVDSELNKGSTFSFTVKLELSSDDGINSMKAFLSENYKTDQGKDIDDYKSTEEMLTDYFEKLIICIEMEKWEKAESLSVIIKSLIPEDKEELVRTAFRIVLSIRRCDYEKSMQGIRELKEKLSLH